MRFRFSGFGFDPTAFSAEKFTKSKRSSHAEKKTYLLCAQRFEETQEINCSCCGLAARRDAPSVLHCAEDPSVRPHADYLWSGGEETCQALSSQPVLVKNSSILTQ